MHSKASLFVIQDGHGQVRAQGELPTTPDGFRRWHEAHPLTAGTPLALETGTVAFFVARELTGLQGEPVVVDAREVRRTAHRPTQKSDRRDAFELCDGLRRGIHRAIDPHRALWGSARAQRLTLETTLTAPLAAPPSRRPSAGCKPSPASARSSAPPSSPSSPTCAGSGTRNTPRALRGSFPPPLPPGEGADFDVAKLNIEEGPCERTTSRRSRLKRPAQRA